MRWRVSSGVDNISSTTPHPMHLLAGRPPRNQGCRRWHAEGGRTALSKDAGWLVCTDWIEVPDGNPCSCPGTVQTISSK